MTRLYLHCSSAAGSTPALPQISDGAARNARDPLAVGKQLHPKSCQVLLKKLQQKLSASALIVMPTPC